MSKDEIKRKRLQILNQQTALNTRWEAGEDVSAELRKCGKQLDALVKKKPRADVMDATAEKRNPNDYLFVDITEDMYKRAAFNGISRSVLRRRLNRDGWEIERALTLTMGKREPSDLKGMTVESYNRLKVEGLRDADICERYGIKFHVLHRFKQQNGLTNTITRGVSK